MFYVNLLEFLIISSKCNFNYDSDSLIPVRFLEILKVIDMIPCGPLGLLRANKVSFEK